MAKPLESRWGHHTLSCLSSSLASIGSLTPLSLLLKLGRLFPQMRKSPAEMKERMAVWKIRIMSFGLWPF